MPKYNFKNKKYSITTAKPIYYKNGRWYADNKVINNWTLSQLQFKDKDGYYKTPLPNGTLAVQDVDDKGNPIKINYIGGTKQQTRNKYWKQAPIIRHAVDSVAKRYNISSNILKRRLTEEGFVDKAIDANNFSYLNSRQELKNNPTSYDKNEFNKIIRGESNYNKLQFTDFNNGFNQFGLDDVATLLEEGKVKLINENWYDTDNENEHKRPVRSANGHTNYDNIGLTAATLKYFRNKASEDFPNASRIFLDEAAGIYYNRGAFGGKTYMKKKYNK